MTLGVWQFRLSRALGRWVTTVAAILTLGRMPPFVSTSAVVSRDGEVLMVVDPIRREPVLPGGHLKWRETPERAVVREVREETGYDVAIRSLLGVYSGEEMTGEPGVVRLVYTADITGGTLRPSPEGKPVWLAADAVAGTRDAPIIRTAAGVTNSTR